MHVHILDLQIAILDALSDDPVITEGQDAVGIFCEGAHQVEKKLISLNVVIVWDCNMLTICGGNILRD